MGADLYIQIESIILAELWFQFKTQPYLSGKLLKHNGIQKNWEDVPDNRGKAELIRNALQIWADDNG